MNEELKSIIKNFNETFGPPHSNSGDSLLNSAYFGSKVTYLFGRLRAKSIRGRFFGKVLGSDDLLIQWHKPKDKKQLSYSRDTRNFGDSLFNKPTLRN